MQVLNRMSADEVPINTGVKVGDFGTGGRTYVNRRKVEKGSGGSMLDMFFDLSFQYGGFGVFGFVLLAIVAVCVLVQSEKSLAHTLQVLAEVETFARALPVPEARPENSGSLVVVTAEPHVVDGGLRDDYFGYSFGPALEMERVPEYCQWVEMRHVNTKVVGKEPDRCAAASADCSVSCSSRSVSSCTSPDDRDREGNSATCCRVVEGADIVEEETSFTYHKGWRPTKINSLLFDNAISYHNPQRDPAPPHKAVSTVDVTLATPGHAGGGLNPLVIQPALLGPVLGPWGTVQLDGSAASRVSDKALQDGFMELDNTHFYSRLEHDGADGLFKAAAKAGASYLLEGVVDVSTIAKGTGVESVMDMAGLGWITKGTCNAGDVRVHLKQRLIRGAGQPITVVGAQSGSRLVEYVFRNGDSRLFVRPGQLTPAQFAAAEGADAQKGAWWPRVGGWLLVAWAFFAGGPSTSLLVGSAQAGKDSTGVVLARNLVEAIGVAAAVVAASWYTFYGPESAAKPIVVAVVVAVVALALRATGKSEPPPEDKAKDL